MNAGKLRIALGLAISLSVHIAVFCCLWTSKATLSSPSETVELQIVSRPVEAVEARRGEVSRAATAPKLPQSIDVPKRKSPKKHENHPTGQRVSKAQKRDSSPRGTADNGITPQIGASGEGSLGGASGGGSGVGASNGEANQSGSAPSADIVKIPKTLTFNDFERLMGGRAEDDRERFVEKRIKRRRSKGAFHSDIKRVRKAMAKRRSITKNAMRLELGEHRSMATAYLSTLHQKMAPHFSRFLTSLDSPIEQMHEKVRNSALKYNPFYVSPPDHERQETLSGPLADLSLRTKTEFEILPSGELGDIRLITSSSNEAFDAAAIGTVLKSAPFAPPSKLLLSLNDRAYVQWTFFRDRKKNAPSRGRMLLLAPLETSRDITIDAGDALNDGVSPD